MTRVGIEFEVVKIYECIELYIEIETTQYFFSVLTLSKFRRLSLF